MKKSIAVLALALLAAGAASAQERGAVREACKDDFAKYCPNIEPGGGRIRDCMREHRAELSQTCTDAVAAARQQRRQHQEQ